jgi:DNA-binding MarR family transcriptional regulator
MLTALAISDGPQHDREEDAGRAGTGRGAQTAGAIARRTGLTPASVTGLLDRLERKGFARRHRHGADGRRVLVEINQEHVASFGAFLVDFMAGLDALYATYSDEDWR